MYLFCFGSLTIVCFTCMQSSFDHMMWVQSNSFQIQMAHLSLFHTAIPENTRKMCPVICPGMVWFWFIHTASDFPESVRAFTHNP